MPNMIIEDCNSLLVEFAPHKFVYPLEFIQDAIEQLGWEDETDEFEAETGRRRYIDKDANVIYAVQGYDWFHKMNEICSAAA